MNLNINLEELKEKQELVSVVLLGGAAILVVLTCIWITKYFLLSTETENIILNAIKQSKRTQAEVDNVIADTDEFVQSLIMNNLFAPPALQNTDIQRVNPVNPIREITAILDKSAYINDDWYSVGDSIPGTGGSARIVAIETNYVTVEFNGTSQNLYPLKATTRASEITTTNSMASMMGGGITINGGNITIDSSAVNNILSRITQGGRGGMMGGGMMGGGGRGGRGGGRGGRGGGGGFGGGGFGGF
ncbi:MAG: hypothetical protein JXA96_03205 [Sedimentisphaerales bacterium]|nr:hypothetical protein [Sedimentisphaerales bacterium]